MRQGAATWRFFVVLGSQGRKCGIALRQRLLTILESAGIDDLLMLVGILLPLEDPGRLDPLDVLELLLFFFAVVDGKVASLRGENGRCWAAIAGTGQPQPIQVNLWRKLLIITILWLVKHIQRWLLLIHLLRLTRLLLLLVII